MLGDEVGPRSLDVLEHCHHILPRIADSVCDTVSLLILRVLDLLSRNIWSVAIKCARGHSSKVDNCDKNLNAGPFFDVMTRCVISDILLLRVFETQLVWFADIKCLIQILLNSSFIAICAFKCSFVGTKLSTFYRCFKIKSFNRHERIWFEGSFSL